MKLYEISNQLLVLQTMLETAENPDDVQCVMDTLESVELEFQDKADNIIKLIKNLEAEAKAIDEEKKRLDKRSKSLNSNVANLKDYLFKEMKRLEKGKVKTDLFTVSIRKNPPKLVVSDENKIPNEFWIVKTEVDNSKLKEAIKFDEDKFKELGIELIQGESLSIK